MSDERMAKKINDRKVNGKRGKGETSVDLRKHRIKDTGGKPRKKYEDPPEKGTMTGRRTEKGGMERLMIVDEGREYVETVAFGASCSLTTPLGIQRKAKYVIKANKSNP